MLAVKLTCWQHGSVTFQFIWSVIMNQFENFLQQALRVVVYNQNLQLGLVRGPLIKGTFLSMKHVEWLNGIIFFTSRTVLLFLFTDILILNTLFFTLYIQTYGDSSADFTSINMCNSLCLALQVKSCNMLFKLLYMYCTAGFQRKC